MLSRGILHVQDNTLFSCVLSCVPLVMWYWPIWSTHKLELCVRGLSPPPSKMDWMVDG